MRAVARAEAQSNPNPKDFQCGLKAVQSTVEPPLDATDLDQVWRSIDRHGALVAAFPDSYLLLPVRDQGDSLADGDVYNNSVVRGHFDSFLLLMDWTASMSVTSF